jgi:protein gp37
MAETLIAWAYYAFAPWIGCTQLSEACDFCYAIAWAHRFHYVDWNGPPRRTSASYWRKPLAWDRQAALAGERRRVFCSELSDVFDNQVPTEWRDDLWRLIDQCRNLDWMLLTKRPQNIPKMLPDGWPWPHVWLGVTAETQEWWDRRIRLLSSIPAPVHFVSVEPMLEPVDIGATSGIDWVICGAEHAKAGKARPMELAWARSLRDQCRSADVAFFMKQICNAGHPVAIDRWPEDLRVRQFPIRLTMTVLNARGSGWSDANMPPGAVYVGRQVRDRRTGAVRFAASKWANPFRTVEEYRSWLVRHPYLVTDLPELRGKDLVCWCAPAPCHADVLRQLANGDAAR